jgi:GPH family glycoside/pentoside/hexuronide:cation symporter
MNLYWQGVSLYLFYFYTDVLGMPNAMAGMIYAIGSLWDAVTDPAMGYVAERTRTRWGRYRPYLLFTPIPLGLSYLLIFWHPGDVSLSTMAVLALTGQFIFRLLFTMASTPYSSLMARMTQNADDRAGMAGARMLFAYAGGFTVVILAGAMLEAVEDDRTAFMMVALVSGVLATAVFWLCFAICREPEEGANERPAPSLKDSFASMRANFPFLIVLASILLMVCGTTIIGKTILYFFEYRMGDRNAGSQALMAFAAVGLLVIPFWTFVTLKTSKRFVWLAGSAVSAVALLTLLFNPAHSNEMVIANYIFISFGFGAFAVTFWGMLPDTVEYGEWKSGARVEATIFGLVTFAQKAAVALSAVVLGFLLDVIGYQAGEVQSAETLSGLTLIIVFVPLAGIVASVAFMLFYPLSPQRHGEIVADLNDRKAAS